MIAQTPAKPSPVPFVVPRVLKKGSKTREALTIEESCVQLSSRACAFMSYASAQYLAGISSLSWLVLTVLQPLPRAVASGCSFLSGDTALPS